MRVWMKTAIFIPLIFLISGCGVIPKNWGKLEGEFWCNNRHTNLAKKNYSDLGGDLRKRMSLAKQGYIYSTAAALGMQKEDGDLTFNYQPPSRLVKMDDLSESRWNGFQADTFILYDGNRKEKLEAIVAFRGSDEFRDYFLHNFWFWPAQYKPAREYVTRIADHPVIKGLPIIVAGYSLGGGLAAHVTQHPDTSGFVTAAWAFNPSPRIGAVEKDTKDRIFVIATYQDILGIFNRDGLGAPRWQQDEEFHLLDSSSFYAHYRVVLSRTILKFADLQFYFDSDKQWSSTEPLDILQSHQEVPGCTPFS